MCAYNEIEKYLERYNLYYVYTCHCLRQIQINYHSLSIVVICHNNYVTLLIANHKLVSRFRWLFSCGKVSVDFFSQYFQFWFYLKL